MTERGPQVTFRNRNILKVGANCSEKSECETRYVFSEECWYLEYCFTA